jgi:hypothetical protein
VLTCAVVGVCLVTVLSERNVGANFETLMHIESESEHVHDCRHEHPVSTRVCRRVVLTCAVVGVCLVQVWSERNVGANFETLMHIESESEHVHDCRHEHHGSTRVCR